MAAPVYLLLGPESGEKHERIKAILGQVVKEIGSQPEMHHYYPSDEGWENQMYQNLTSVGLFATWQFVILSQVESLSSRECSRLASFLKPLLAQKKQSLSATLILVSDQTYLKEGKVLQSAIPKEYTEVFYEMFENQKEEWIRKYFQRHGVLITPDGIKTLLSLVENNTTEMKIAANQLILFWQLEKRSTPIDGDAIDSYLANTKEEDAYTLFPSILARDLQSSLRILQQIFALGDSKTNYTLYSQLLYQFRKFLSIEEVYSQSRDIDYAFKNATVLGTRAWVIAPKEKAAYKKGLQNYSLMQARKALSALEDYDIPLKSAGDLSQVVWEQLLATIILHNGEKSDPPLFVITAAMS